MKKWIAFWLIFALLLPLCACDTQEEEPEIVSPIRFYYRRTEPVYADADSVITFEVREAAGHESDYLYLMNLYLKGPQSPLFSRTFPKHVSVEQLEIRDSHAYIRVNDEFSYLAGLDMTFACVCLTKTLCEMTGATKVTITTPNSLLDGKQSITMDLNSILLVDFTSTP